MICFCHNTSCPVSQQASLGITYTTDVQRSQTTNTSLKTKRAAPSLGVAHHSTFFAERFRHATNQMTFKPVKEVTIQTNQLSLPQNSVSNLGLSKEPIAYHVNAAWLTKCLASQLANKVRSPPTHIPCIAYLLGPDSMYIDVFIIVCGQVEFDSVKGDWFLIQQQSFAHFKI